MKRLLQFFTLLTLALVGGAEITWAETEEWQTVWEENIAKVCTDWVSSTTTTNGEVTLLDNGNYKNISVKQGSSTYTFNLNLGVGVGRTAQLMCRYQASTSAQNAGIYYNWNATSTIAFLNVKAGQRVIIGTTSNSVLTVDNASTEAIAPEAYTHTYLTNKTLTYYKNIYTVTSDGTVAVTIPAYVYVGYVAVQKKYEAGTCESPISKISGVAGTSRKFTLACLTTGASIFYSEKELAVEDEGWKEYTSEVTTDAEIIYAYAKTADATSEIVSFETGAGTEIKLNAPIINRNSYSDGNYNVSFSSIQTDLSLAPSSVAYSYSIDGSEFQTGASAAVAEGSTITVVATSDGYANSEEVSWISKSRPTDLTRIWNQDYTNLTSDTGNGAYGVVLASDATFSCNERDFYNITGYNGGNGNIDVAVNDNVGLNTSEGFSLRCKGNDSGILQNKKTGYLGIKNLLPGQTIIITVSNVPLRVDYGVTLEEGMSTSSEYYFTATGTTASIVVPNGTYNYVKTIEVKGKTETITLSADYTYSTFSSTANLDFTDNADVEAYIAQVENDCVTVTLTKVEQVPAGEGVILKKIGDNTTAAVKVLASAEALSNNALVGVTEANTVSLETLAAAGNAYVLVDDEKFSKVSEGASGYISAGKAYLEYTPVAGASVNSLRISFGEPTAVADVEAKQETGDNAIYNVQGIHVSKPTAPGMYIMNGKAFIVK